MNLTAGRKYNVKVTGVRFKKTYGTGQGPMHIYYIDITDKSGDTAVVEYKALNDDIEGKFEVGQYQFILVRFSSPEVVVEPCEPPEEEVLAAPYMPQSSNQSQVTVTRSPMNLNVSGSSVTFAMAYAKDILCAELGNRVQGSYATSEDIKRMLTNADTINKAICERVKTQ